MSSAIKRIWQHLSVKRILALSVVVTIAAFMLLLFLLSLGDSDLPPYNPPFPGEHLAWKILAVVVWPLVFVAGLLDHDPPFALWLPLTFAAGIFWAVVIESFIVLRRARRTPF